MTLIVRVRVKQEEAKCVEAAGVAAASGQLIREISYSLCRSI